MKEKISKPLIPFNSREYEKRISKLTCKEYDNFKKIILSEKITIKEKSIKKLYNKLGVTSQTELMVLYCLNYYNEFSSEKLEKVMEENK